MKNKGFFLIIATACLLIACKPNPTKTASDIQAESIDFDFFSSRSKIKIDKKGLDFSLSMNLRIQKDQLIWINLSNTMVGKIGKCKFTTDSVFVLRDYQAKEYYKGSLIELNKRLGYELSYQMFQNILLGEMPLSTLDSATVTKEKGEREPTGKEKTVMVGPILMQ